MLALGSHSPRFVLGQHRGDRARSGSLRRRLAVEGGSASVNKVRPQSRSPAFPPPSLELTFPSFSSLVLQGRARRPSRGAKGKGETRNLSSGFETQRAAGGWDRVRSYAWAAAWAASPRSGWRGIRSGRRGRDPPPGRRQRGGSTAARSDSSFKIRRVCLKNETHIF